MPGRHPPRIRLGRLAYLLWDGRARARVVLAAATGAGVIGLLALGPVPSHASSNPLPTSTVPAPPIPVPLPVPPAKLPAPPTPAVTVPSLPLPSVSKPQAPVSSTGSGTASSSSQAAPSGTSAASGSTYAGQAPAQVGALAAGATPAQGQVGHSGPVSRRSKRAGSRGYPKRFLFRLLRGRLGCLEELPQQQRRVLMLRTGIGGATSHGRRQVARMLRVSLRREGQIERQGVSGIRAGARHGCPALEPGAARALFAAAEAASQVEQLVPAALGTTRSPTARRRHKGTKPRQSVAAATTHVQQGAIPAPSHSSSTTLFWILIATGLFAATAVAGPTARRRARHRLATAPRATAPVPEADEIAAVGAGAAVAARKGSQAERERDIEGALAVYRRADAAGDAQGATNLGVLLEQRGDLDGAAAAYRRADERGDVNGAFNLGLLLAELGDTAGAMAALRRADVRGDAAGASNLGVLLERQGDLDGALAAYRRADERGDPNGSFNLGLLLAARGDLAAARQAYLRACDCGDDQVAQRARAALDDLASD